MIKRILSSRLPLIVYNPVKVFDIKYFKEIFNSGALPVFERNGEQAWDWATGHGGKSVRWDQIPGDLRDSRGRDPPRGPHGHRGDRDGPGGPTAAKYAHGQTLGAHLQRVLVQS